jgi:hypothetical protein
MALRGYELKGSLADRRGDQSHDHESAKKSGVGLQ